MNLTGVEWLCLGVAAALIVFGARWVFRRRPSVYRKELPRIYEPHDLGPNPDSTNFYFRNLDQSLADIPQKLKQFRDLERELQGLDPVAWTFLKSELEPLLTVKDPVRGWEALWNKLKQAKAYKRSGYSHAAFNPPSVVKGKKTSDLEAGNGASKALCEVKTINMSEVEAERRLTGGVGTSEDQLNAAFLGKLGAPRQDSCGASTVRSSDHHHVIPVDMSFIRSRMNGDSTSSRSYSDL
jgi:hypothetical protein